MIYIKRILKAIYLRFKYRSFDIHSYNIHKSLKISKGARINKGVIIGENVNIGDYSYLNNNSVVFNTDIGKFCSISYNCMIGLPNHPYENLSTSPFLYSEKNILKNGFSYDDEISKTIIGNDVWIGTNAVILKGVNIGNGAIIGAGAIVTKDVPPFAIVVGSPAKILKMRFNSEQIEFLNDFSYWDNYEKKISEISNLVSKRGDWFKELNDRNY